MAILTPEIIEKAARAAYESFVKSSTRPKRAWGDLRSEDRRVVLRDTQAALEASLPEILEVAAKVPEGHAKLIREQNRIWALAGQPPDKSSLYVAELLEQKATSIRSLHTKGGTENG